MDICSVFALPNLNVNLLASLQPFQKLAEMITNLIIHL